MKALSFWELKRLSGELNAHYEGSQLQEVRVNDRYLALGFYCKRNLSWLVADLNLGTPFLFFTEDFCPVERSGASKPIGLFLKAHGKGLFFQESFVVENLGRVLRLNLGQGKHSQKSEFLNKTDCTVVFQLVPKLVNVEVEAHGKHIFWNKPQDLKPSQVFPQSELQPQEKIRSNLEIIETWKNFSKPKIQRAQETPEQIWENQRKQNILKKEKALQVILEGLAEEKEKQWLQFGELLKLTGNLDVSPDFVGFLDLSKSYSENLQRAFAKAKQLKGKREGTLQRAEILRLEIESLKNAKYGEAKFGGHQKENKNDLHAVASSTGRKKVLKSGTIAYLGKSGADNLKILRAAKPWDYWLHLKDYPGAHLVIRRNRLENIPDSDFIEAAQWLIRESVRGAVPGQNENYCFIVCEVRFVRPIKGDKLGRVHYSSEKSLKLKY